MKNDRRDYLNSTNYYNYIDNNSTWSYGRCSNKWKSI